MGKYLLATRAGTGAVHGWTAVRGFHPRGRRSIELEAESENIWLP